MDELSSIAYHIGADPVFYLEPLPDRAYSGYEMSSTLARYLVGNSFIEHLAYYRLSEPDKIYISSGERSLTEFFCTSFGMSREAAEENIRHIRASTQTDIRMIRYGKEGNAFFSHLYPLPQLSAKPQAFVLALIPVKRVAPLLDTLLSDGDSAVAVFDAHGNEIYRKGTLDESFPLRDHALDGGAAEERIPFGGKRYILQRVISDSNGWTYVSVIRQNAALSGVANKQLVVIFLLLILVFVAISAMLLSIIVQYRSISKLADTVAGGGAESEAGDAAVDERVLLSNTIASLKDDSLQKQKFETAYHEAEAASRAKSAFLSNMSHDIRTPMNAVIGMTAIALRHVDDPAYVRECLQKVQASSQYLLDIINNVLDMSRIESGRFTPAEETVELPALIDSLVALIEPAMEAKHQRLIVDRTAADLPQPAVIGDSVRLTQVFVNILSNAVKFTPDGGTVTLRVRQEAADEAGSAPEFTCGSA